MSAWICSDKHINAVVTAYADQNGITDAAELDRIANLLLEENTKSVDYRYQETNERFVIKFERVEMAPIDAYKLTRSYSYQACEHPGWDADDNEARKISRSVLTYFQEAGLSAYSKSYDKAKWSI